MDDRKGLPEPQLDERNAPFTAGADEHKLLLARCRDCQALMAPPVANCTTCLSDAIEWWESTGAGTVFSFIVYHRCWIPAFEPFMPYNVSIIELDDGPRILSNVLLGSDEQLRIGARVTVGFEQRGEASTVPVFTLA
jgi:uncharacterized protein